MAKTTGITNVTAAMFDLLEPLESEDRKKCVKAAMVLLGEDFAVAASPEVGPPAETVGTGNGHVAVASTRQLGEKVKRWMVQHKVTDAHLDQIYHIDGTVELIAHSVPGATKKEKTINCYLLVGVRSLIQNDEPKFSDKEGMEFCQITQAYDKNNHTTNRQALSNRVSGDRRTGFTLTVPGLRDAANLIKSMGQQGE